MQKELKPLTLSDLVESAKRFCEEESTFANKTLFGITDGKAVGTYIEHKFQEYLSAHYLLDAGSSAKGLDLPSVDTDIKVTSIEQPQSSCPYTDAKQKIYGLGYNLLIFVYDKKDDPETRSTRLDFVSCTFIENKRTADYTTTFRLLELLKDGGNEEDIIAFLSDKKIPADEITLKNLAQMILQTPPTLGYLTISNALQWRLQYGRVVNIQENVEGITKIIDYTNRTNATI